MIECLKDITFDAPEKTKTNPKKVPGQVQWPGQQVSTNKKITEHLLGVTRRMDKLHVRSVIKKVTRRKHVSEF